MLYLLFLLFVCLELCLLSESYSVLLILCNYCFMFVFCWYFFLCFFLEMCIMKRNVVQFM